MHNVSTILDSKALQQVAGTSGWARRVRELRNEGASNLTLSRPEAIKLIAQVRRAPSKDQLDVLQWLIRKFPKQSQELLENR